MNRLILFRHGKAEHDSASGRDFDRRLAPRGVEESADMSRSLADLGLAPEVVLVSPAARTRETWLAAAPAFPAAQARFDDDLYHAEPATLRRLIAEAAGVSGAVMVVGHNPGLQDLALALLKEGRADPSIVSRAQAHFPTASAAVFLIDGEGRPAADGLFFPRDRRSF